jgi:hypothetical protein
MAPCVKPSLSLNYPQTQYARPRRAANAVSYDDHRARILSPLAPQEAEAALRDMLVAAKAISDGYARGSRQPAAIFVIRRES